MRATGQRADEEGEPHLLCAVFQDITERRLLEQEILDFAHCERVLVGFDLHDGLGQDLTGVSLMLAGVVSKLPPTAVPFLTELREIQESLSEAISTCRELAQGISPTAGDGGGLISAVGQLVVRMSKLHHVQIILRTRGQEFALDDTVAEHLYRITQEAANNAISVWISVNRVLFAVDDVLNRIQQNPSL